MSRSLPGQQTVGTGSSNGSRRRRGCGSSHGGPVGGRLLDRTRVVAIVAAPDRARRQAVVAGITKLPEGAVGVAAAGGLAELRRGHKDHTGFAFAYGAGGLWREGRRVAVGPPVVAGVTELEEPARVEGRRLARRDGGTERQQHNGHTPLHLLRYTAVASRIRKSATSTSPSRVRAELLCVDKPGRAYLYFHAATTSHTTSVVHVSGTIS